MKKILILAILVPFKLFSQVPNSFSDQEKIYGLSKIWKEVEYNYAYFEKIGSEQWDSLYTEMINSVVKTKNDYEYFRELQKFVGFIKDGHTRIRKFPTIDLYTTVFYDYKIEFEWIEGKVIVTRINKDKMDEIPVGSELIEINEMKTQDYLITNVVPYISASTDHIRMNEAAIYILEGLKNMKYDIKLKTPDSNIIELKLKHGWDKSKNMSDEVYPEYIDRDEISFKFLENDIGYLNIDSFDDISIVEEFKRLLPEIRKSKKIIIDIRENGGGNTIFGLEILSYFTNDTLLYQPKMRSRLHISQNKANGMMYNLEDTSQADWIRDAYLDYHNKLYTDFDYSPYKVTHSTEPVIIPTLVLISNNTVSAAEDFLVPMKEIKHIKTMGEITAGSTGTPYIFDLLGGSKVYICSMQSYYPDGTEYVGVGIKPDLEINRTVNGLIKQKDEILEKAIEYLKEE